MTDRHLSFWEATSLMVGAGVGAGIMAVPYLAERVGLVGLALILPIAWAASALIHLMLAEVLFRTGRDLQIVELMRLYVLRGRIGRWLLWAVFALLSVAFLANLAAYVSGAGEIVADLTGIDRRAGRAPRLCRLGRCGLLRPEGGRRSPSASAPSRWSGCVAAHRRRGRRASSVPPAAGPVRIRRPSGWRSTAWSCTPMDLLQRAPGGAGPRPDRQGAVRAILLGLAINGVLTAVVALVALGISTPVTEVAIIGIADRLGSGRASIGLALHRRRPGHQLLVGLAGPGRHPPRADGHLRSGSPGCWPRCRRCCSSGWAPGSSSSACAWPPAPPPSWWPSSPCPCTGRRSAPGRSPTRAGRSAAGAARRCWPWRCSRWP